MAYKTKSKPTSGSEPPKKTLYHSQLCQMGAVHVKIESDVLPSKFQGKPPYIFLEIDGFERQYQCENDGCAEALDGRKGQKVMIEATGSKEDAAIKVLAAGAEQEADDPGSEAAEERQPERPAKKVDGKRPWQKQQEQAAAAPANGGDKAAMLMRERMCYANALRMGLSIAYATAAEFAAKSGISPEVQSVCAWATGFAIKMERNGWELIPSDHLVEMKINPPKEDK